MRSISEQMLEEDKLMCYWKKHWQECQLRSMDADAGRKAYYCNPKGDKCIERQPC